MIEPSFHRKCQDVLHAGTVKDFSNQIVNFVQDRGFGWMAAMVIIDHAPGMTEFQTVTNAPNAFLSDFENLNLGRIDPVSQHCKQTTMPIVWDRSTYKEGQQRQLWERQAEFGYRSGFAFAMHFDKGLHFMFGVDCDRDKCDQIASYKTVLEDVLIFGSYAQAAAFELSLPSRPRPDNGWSLSRAEIEVLQWNMDGKTLWEIGRLMAISERHVDLLIQRAMKKLGCSNKYETALRAIKLGLINCI